MDASFEWLLSNFTALTGFHVLLILITSGIAVSIAWKVFKNIHVETLGAHKELIETRSIQVTVHRDEQQKIEIELQKAREELQKLLENKSKEYGIKRDLEVTQTIGRVNMFSMKSAVNRLLQYVIGLQANGLLQARIGYLIGVSENEEKKKKLGDLGRELAEYGWEAVSKADSFYEELPEVAEMLKKPVTAMNSGNSAIPAWDLEKNAKILEKFEELDPSEAASQETANIEPLN